jgi:mannose-1-phosphate guanylyltransferase / mannose-6-phosphate isomerase
MDYRFLVQDQLNAIGAEAQIVLGPMRRDSGPVVAVAAEIAARRSPDTVVIVFAADHVVQNRPMLVDICKRAAAQAAQGSVVTLGITPTRPATGYDYIRAAEPGVPGSGIRKVAEFKEKPDLATAQKYVADGYFWNCGYFVFRADTMQAELARFEPETAEAARVTVENASKDLMDGDSFRKAPKKSIDYAVIERTEKLALAPADIGWLDAGTWATVWELSEREGAGNSVQSHGVVLDARNVHVRSDEHHLTPVVGMDDVIGVTTQDAVLVLHRDQADKVKTLVDQLKNFSRREASEQKRILRPWGYYQSIASGARHQVKRIVVKPGDRLSLQKHFRRAEQWIVVKGGRSGSRRRALFRA